MQIDRATLERLLTLNDGQLKFIIGRIAGESGIDMASVRSAIKNISDSDLASISAQIEEMQNQRRRGGR